MTISAWRVAGLALGLAAGLDLAVAAPYAGASGQVFDFTSFTVVADAPVTYGPIGTTAAYQQNGGPLGSSFLSAVARYDGFIAAAAQTSVSSGGNEWEWTSRVQFRDDYVNPAAAPQAFVFDFDIFAMSLRIFDREGTTQTAEIFAQVQVNRSDGSSTALFRIDETLTGGVFSLQLADSGNYVPPSTFTCALPTFGGRCADARYDFDPYHGSIPLGSFGPGETFTVQYDLSARVKARTIGVNGASAFIGDPFDVTGSGVGGVVHPFTPAVPEPASWLLALGGAAALLAWNRRPRGR